MGLLRAGRLGAGLLALGRSLSEDPGGYADVARVTLRKVAHLG